MGEWADDVLALTDAPVVPIGVSMGGYLAFELWRRAAERIPALVLADTRAAAETEESRAGRERTIATIHEGGAEALWSDLSPRLLSPSGVARGAGAGARVSSWGETPRSSSPPSRRFATDRTPARP